mmetsp:Transcript_100989/g.324254  ORF Transcript_100989/g.324254 Transcript_100989/m.324254 type:complete len:806 (-) Transcript_100989:2-2419(-)
MFLAPPGGVVPPVLPVGVIPEAPVLPGAGGYTSGGLQLGPSATAPHHPSAASGGSVFSGGLRKSGSALVADRPPCTLPILLVPGFISSRLDAVSSTICPHWEGRPIWISLSRLGFQSMHGKGLWENPDPEHQTLKNKWLQHLCLRGPEEETPGVHLQAPDGLEGVKCLDPESLFGMAAEGSKLFGPIMKVLEECGYEAGKDFDAAPYDWRFAPSILQRRDGFYDRMATKVEALNSRGTGVVLLGHSMGNKTISYFLEYAKRSKGQQWLDKNVYSWLAAGAPLLGAPQALRSTVQGMAEVRPLFSLDEATLFARSVSASPWLFPIGDLDASPYCFLRRQGVLQIRNLHAGITAGCLSSTRNSVMLTVEVCWGSNGETDALTTNTSMVQEGAGGADGRVTFNEECNVMVFGGPPEMPTDATVRVIVKEKGIHDDEDKNPLRRLGKGLVAGAKCIGEAIQGRAGWGVPKAYTQPMSLAESLATGRRDGDGFCEICLQVGNSQGSVTFQARWLDFRGLRAEWLGSETLSDAHRHNGEVPVRHSSRKHEIYEHLDMPQLLRMECPEVLDVVNKYYRQDELCRHDGMRDCPPIRRIVAVHGVNVKTEIMYALRVNTVRTKPKTLTTRFVLDHDTQLVHEMPGRSMSGGMVYEQEGGSEPSGDGTVPLASMEHCRSWSKQLDLRVEHLEGAVHSTMLFDERFHDIIKSALVPAPSDADSGRHLLQAAISGGSGDLGAAPRKHIWQAAKDETCSSWWDCPADVSEQLTAAAASGPGGVLRVQIRGHDYEVDLGRMVQTNLRFGTERRLRVVDT